MAELSYLKIFFDQMAGLETLTNEEVGSLLRGLWRYAQFKETPSLTGNERIMWPMFKNAQDKAEEAYIEYIKKASESGKKGGRPKKGYGFSEKGTLSEKGYGFSEKCKNPIEEDEEDEEDEEAEVVVVNDDGDGRCCQLKKSDLEYHGFPTRRKDLDKANELCNKYSKEWLLQALDRASDQSVEARNWRYVEKILTEWHKNGGIDPKGKTAAIIAKYLSRENEKAPKSYSSFDEMYGN